MSNPQSRALLEELALHGPAWRKPASVVVERPEDFVARVEELGLEGVVVGRLSSTYIPGRRCTAWVEHKLRREECFAATGVRPTRDGIAEAMFIARHRNGGSLMRAGSVELGLGRELIKRLDEHLGELAPRRGASISWYPPEVSVIASAHGLPDGPGRDACARSSTPKPRGRLLGALAEGGQGGRACAAGACR